MGNLNSADEFKSLKQTLGRMIKLLDTLYSENEITHKDTYQTHKKNLNDFIQYIEMMEANNEPEDNDLTTKKPYLILNMRTRTIEMVEECSDFISKEKQENQNSLAGLIRNSDSPIAGAANNDRKTSLDLPDIEVYDTKTPT